MSSDSAILGATTTGGAAATAAVASTGNSRLAILIAILVLIALGLIAYFVRKKSKRQ